MPAIAAVAPEATSIISVIFFVIHESRYKEALVPENIINSHSEYFNFFANSTFYYKSVFVQSETLLLKQ